MIIKKYYFYLQFRANDFDSQLIYWVFFLSQ